MERRIMTPMHQVMRESSIATNRLDAGFESEISR